MIPSINLEELSEELIDTMRVLAYTDCSSDPKFVEQRRAYFYRKYGAYFDKTRGTSVKHRLSVEGIDHPAEIAYLIFVHPLGEMTPIELSEECENVYWDYLACVDPDEIPINSYIEEL